MKKKFIQYIFPSMCSFLLTGVYSIVDGIFVGNAVGDHGLAAINIVWPLIALIAALGTGVGMGTSVLMSLNLGAGNKEKADKTEGTGIALLIASALILTAFLFFLGHPLLLLLGAEGDILSFALTYLHYSLIGCAVQVFATGTLPIMRNLGGSFYAMISMAVGCAANIFLDWLFVFELDMAIKGAALATISGQFITLLFCLYFYLKPQNRIPLACLKPDWHLGRSIIKIGLSPFGLTYLPSVTIIFMNLQSLKYGGTEAVSAYAVLAYVLSFMELVVQGISDGSQPLLSYSRGKQDFHALKTYTLWTFLLTFVIGILGGGFIFLFRDMIPVVYGTSAETAEIILNAAPAFALVMILYGFSKCVISYLYATNQIVFSSLMVYGEILLTFVFIWLLPLLLGLDGVWYTMPAVQAVLVAAGSLFLLKSRNVLQGTSSTAELKNSW